MRERASEERLDALREEAERHGTVRSPGAEIESGPIPRGQGSGGGGDGDARGMPGGSGSDGGGGSSDAPGYYGLPVLKPPVWTWEIPVYFFVGGMAGMAAVIGLAALLAGDVALLAGPGHRGLLRGALHLAAGGALLSTVLLILDLGRPARFLNMLRVFKWRSAMSVGAWTLAAFGTASVSASVLELAGVSGAPLLAVVGAAAALGVILATYTGVLLAVTAVPAWFTHRRLLPLHFGLAGLGSAAAALELLGFRTGALHLLGLGVAGAETLVLAWTELRRHGAADRALREGRPGILIRSAGILSGPVALLLRLVGLVPLAALAFLVGALTSRFGWLEAGGESARDPEATFAAQGGAVAPR